MQKEVKLFLILSISLVFTGLALKVQGSFNASTPWQTAGYILNQEENKKNNTPIVEKNPSLELKNNVKTINLSAESGLSIIFDPQNKEEKILWEKNKKTKTAIASITKLVTAYISKEENPNMYLDEYLEPLLIKSHNVSAEYLAELNNRDNFILEMNSFAKEAGAMSTEFNNPTGLDEPLTNTSTAEDLYKIIKTIFLKHPEIFEITLKKDVLIGETLFKNTNLLLDENLPQKIIGGKTGETDLAKQALVILTKNPFGEGIIINILLRSDDRFDDMKTLLTWINNSYEIKNI